MTSARVVVVGSINRDYVCRVASLPRPGETLLGGELSLGAGGKGGNQAVAAARMGAPCSMLGSVGDDADGRALRDALAGQGVDVERVTVFASAPTGAAFVFVDPSGENSIVVAPGANAALTGPVTGALVQETAGAGDVLVAQAEIPVDGLIAAVDTAVAIGARVVLNLAPFQPLPPRVLSHCDPLVVNESEALSLLGLDPDGQVGESDLVTRLRAQTRSAVVTLGGRGAIVAHAGGGVDHVLTDTVPVVDSTGAGDAFTGALAARLAQGADLSNAVRIGVAAGTYAVQRAGAQASYPSVSDLLP